LEIAGGWQFLPRLAAPVQNSSGHRRTGEGSIMVYMPPWLGQAPYSAPENPKRKIPRFAHLGDILIIAAAVGVVIFIVGLISAILTASGG
jgi:hypothetical protein